MYQGIAKSLIRVFNTKRSLDDLAASLVGTADHAYSVRQLDVVGYAGQLLLSLPLSRQLESVGRYYQALCLNHRGRGDTSRAISLFEEVADSASSQYRAKGMLALGTSFLGAGDYNAALSFYREVMSIVACDREFDPVTICIAGRMTAVIRGLNGDHRGAVADLDKMFPITRLAASRQPYVYYDYLNTLAVELADMGSLKRALRASEIALRSPFARAYPEWRETYDDIVAKQRRASRSVVPVTQRVEAMHNLVHLPSAQRETSKSPEPDPQGTQARVLSFNQWKTMLKGSNPSVLDKLSPEQRKRLTTGEKLIRLMDLISHEDTDDETLDRILEAVEAIMTKRRTQRPS